MTTQDALITSLSPIITNFNDSVPQELTGLPKGVEGMTRTYNGHTYYFVLNFSHTAVYNTTFNLPGGLSGPATVVGENRAVNASGGTMTDSFDSYGIHVYRF